MDFPPLPDYLPSPMKDAILKADVLIEALPHIQRFQAETVVVKFGGSSMDNPSVVHEILRDVAFMSCVGLRPVLVHGGGKAINARMKEAGLQSRFLRGLRVTDEATIGIVEQVLNREVNPHLVQILDQEFHCKARPIYGEDIISVRKQTGSDPETGAPLDWGFVGDITDVDAEPVRAFLNAGITPVITPLGSDGSHLYNINADAAAAGLAERLRARKLVFLSDVPGLLSDPSDPASLISTLKLSEVEDLVRRGIISGGMLPKINGALRALHAGVRKTHIINAAIPHSLLLELFTDRGIGTEIVNDRNA